MIDKRGIFGGFNRQKLGVIRGDLILFMLKEILWIIISLKKRGYQGDFIENMFLFCNEIFVVFDIFKI